MSTRPKLSPGPFERRVLEVLRGGMRGSRQLDVATAVGISQQQLSNVLAGKRAMTLVEFMRLCKALGIRAHEVVELAEITEH